MNEKWTGKIERPLRVWYSPRLSDDIYLHFSEILKAVKKYSRKFSGKVLDVGAGKMPYRRFFNVSEYVSMDKFSYPRIGVVADAEKTFPFKANSFDGVVSFQLIEHLMNYQKTIDEIYRVLKKGGKCLLTTNMAAPLHGEPYDYFRFTKYSLKKLFSKFKYVEIKENGGAALSIVQLAIWGISEKLPSIIAKPVIMFLGIVGKAADKIFYNPVFTLNYSVFAVK